MLLLVGGGLVFFPSDEPEGEGLHTVVAHCTVQASNAAVHGGEPVTQVVAVVRGLARVGAELLVYCGLYGGKVGFCELVELACGDVVGEDCGFGGCGCDIHGVVPLSALLGSA